MFAKLLMFVTLLLGGFVGYISGFAMGKQQTLELIQEGREIQLTTVSGTAKVPNAATLSQDQLDCYKAMLGDTLYAKYLGGADLSADQASKVAGCTATAASPVSALAPTSAPVATATTTPAH